MMFQERLYIEDIQKILRYRDRRSARRWCRNNNVRIFSDNGSNKQFVLKEEFERQLNQNDGTRLPNPKHTYIYKVRNGSGYHPQGEYEKAFLSTLQKIINK